MKIFLHSNQRKSLFLIVSSDTNHIFKNKNRLKLFEIFINSTVFLKSVFFIDNLYKQKIYINEPIREIRLLKF